MEAKAQSLSFLGSEGIVQIPFFQRSYVWGKNNWEDMLLALLEFDKNHFLGSIILKHLPKESGKSPKVLVIDGQQRLTTLSILLRALYNSFDSQTQDNCRKEIEGYLFYKKNATDSNLLVKIEHSKIDREYFGQVIENKITPASIDSSKKTNNILSCFKYFTDEINTLDKDLRKELFNHLVDPMNRILVVIDLSAEDDEQTIFDTINSAGVRLSGADIIKNALFQRVIEISNEEEAEKLHKGCWEDIFAPNEEETTFWDTARQTGRLKRDNIEILLHSIAVIEKIFDPEKKEHTLENLSNLYKQHINTLQKNELSDFIRNIAQYAKLFREKMLVFDNKSHLFGFDDYQARLFHILSVCEISTFHPYILSLYRQYANDENRLKVEFLKLEKLIIRRMISNAETKNYNKLCKDFINDQSKIDVVLAETTDDVVVVGLDKINNKNAALLLFWIELYRRNKDPRCDSTELKYVYSLEHIMPQKWEEFWNNVPVVGEDNNPINETDKAKIHRYKMIYSLGNMTLLKTSLNASLSNFEFKRKIEGDGRKKGMKAYAELGITKFDIVEKFEKGNTKWNENSISCRTKELSADVLSMWGEQPDIGATNA